jgi:hypothetical protein
LKSRNIPDTFVMFQIWGKCLTQIWDVCWNISVTPALLVLWNLWYAENNIACLKCYKTLGNTVADRLLASKTVSPNYIVTYLTQRVRNKTKAIQEVLTHVKFSHIMTALH